MTSRLLLLELKDHLEGIVHDYAFPSPDGEPVDTRVFLHGLPQEQQDHCFPFVIARWMNGNLNDSGVHTGQLVDTVGLALGVFAPKDQEQAGILLADLIDCLRIGLWHDRILANRFELELPLATTIPDVRQKWNEYHLATMETRWNYVWPSRGLREMTEKEYAQR